MFARALVPIDGSPLALEALPAARQALGARGAVVLVAVVEPASALLARTARSGAAGRSARVAIELAEHSAEEDREEAEAHLEEARGRARDLGLRVARIVVCEGEPGPEILAERARSQCDVIIMSTNGRSGIRRAVLGSVADHVVRHAEGVPVLLVRPVGGSRKR
jgi:nucleotide-binding universal stress UspA family protein